ncbi:MAG: DUF58 domain-containing protein [Pedosphaera sp.]|nr:DUF58 domain-containing protein [Pedosphaera sp.]
MRIRNLELRARAVVEGFWTGLHRSPYHGFSVEFTEYRPYSPGDDQRFVDWRVYARSDRCFIKKFEEETNLRCHLLVDQSRSMTFGTVGYTKAEYGATLAATLAQFLHLQGDATGLLTFDETVREFLPARRRPGHLRRLMLALEPRAEGRAEGRSTDLRAPLQRIIEIVRGRGLLVLITDLLTPIDSLQSELRTLTARGHEVIVFQILDPAERTLDLGPSALLEDLETGQTLWIDPNSAGGEYRRNLEAHLASAAAICDVLGITWHRLTTNQPLELALFEFLRDRTARSRRARLLVGRGRGGGR